jgi:hypothetical protein
MAYTAGRGTAAWSGFAVSDHPFVHKDADTFLVQKSFGLKQDVKWNIIPVITPGMQEPLSYRVEGLHTVAGNVQVPFYPELALALLKGLLATVTETDVVLKQINVAITNDDGSHHITFQINSETPIVLDTTGDISIDTSTLIDLINFASGVVTASYFDVPNNIIKLIGSADFSLTITPDSTDTASQTLYTNGAVTHKFIGSETVPNVYYSFQQYEDLSCMNLVGCVPNQLEIDIEKGNPIQLNYGFIGMHGFDQKGTQGKSTGQNAISFPVTLVVSTSDQIKLAVDGGSAIEVTIPAAAYSTGETLSAAINTAIESTTTLLDTYRRPKVACYVNSANKLVFYSGTKGSASTVAWTAGTNDASTLLGKGTQTETAGAATNAVAPTGSSIQPFIATRAILKLAGVEVPGVEKIKIVANNGIVAQDVVGYSFSPQPVIGKRREIKITVDCVFTDPSWLAKFVANTTAQIEVDLETATPIVGTHNYAGKIYLNACKVVSIPLPNVSGPGVIKQQLTLQAYEDVTHQDIEIDVTNNLATV